MDPSNRNLTHIFNPDSTIPQPENTQTQPSEYVTNYSPPHPDATFPQSPYPQNLPPSQYFQNFVPPQLLQNFNPFGAPSNHQHYGQHSTSYQSMQHQAYVNSLSGVFGAAGIRAPFPIHPAAVIGNASYTSSHEAEPATPQSRTQQEEPAHKVESSGSTPEEDGRRGVRNNWTDEENTRLASSWLNNSNDPVDGNAKKADFYWRSVTEEFNKNRPKDARKRSSKQCKSHWGTINKATVHFNGVYERAKNTYCSGQSDDMLMNKTREWFKAENQQKPFSMEYLWLVVKKNPKWRRVYMERSKGKRTKVSESGAYTSSSNQEEEDASLTRERRPEGQKSAKGRKGKDKCKLDSSSLIQPSENMRLYHEAIAKRASALAAIAEASKERTKMKKMQTYLSLLEKDTSDFNDARLKQHEQVLEQLQLELFS